MNPARITAAVLLATAAATTINPTAVGAADQATCTLTAQPWDGRSYALTAVVDGTPTPLITVQSGMLTGQTSWTLTGITEVWWAAKDPARQAVAADFHDVYDVAGCSLVGGYRGIAGRQDSITLTARAPVTICHWAGPPTGPTPGGPGQYVVVTVDDDATRGGHGDHDHDLIPAPGDGCPVAVTTTTTVEPTTTTGPGPITTWSTTPPPSVVDEPLTPAPVTTTAELRSPYAPTLPATGPGLAARLGLAGLMTVALGAVAVAIGRRLDGER